jgi:hypothetical protein
VIDQNTLRARSQVEALLESARTRREPGRRGGEYPQSRSRGVLRLLLKLGGATLGVALLAVAVAVLSPLVWPSDPDASLVLENGRLTGETVGSVWQVDPDTGTILVTASLLGLRAVPLAVTGDTRIVVGDKQGGIRDLAKNTPVRVSYEVRENIRLATSIELLGADGTGGSQATTIAVAAAPRPESGPGHWVEVGVFENADAAGSVASRLLEQNFPVSIDSVTLGAGHRAELRVRVGPLTDDAEVSATLQGLQTLGYRASVARSIAPSS